MEQAYEIMAAGFKVRSARAVPTTSWPGLNPLSHARSASALLPYGPRSIRGGATTIVYQLDRRWMKGPSSASPWAGILKGLEGPSNTPLLILFDEPDIDHPQPKAPPKPADSIIGEEFSRLAEIWREETLASSSLTEICSHRAYQRIIGLGAPVIPHILRAVASGQRHWGWALAAITGENPASETDSPRSAAQSWLRCNTVDLST